jgi:hypothetical protein
MFEKIKNQKTQILIAHLKEGIDRTQKRFLAGKKSFLGFRGYRTFFLPLHTPYVMLEKIKKLKFLLLIRR